ncbi:hypothetical protein A9Q99_22310 [Gammaproteobacteria bacterium 45_16_T64]|nr:hypothetical protein A9Q99_22310 [Gammaproteobacteria bacterium 45_16_T64]
MGIIASFCRFTCGAIPKAPSAEVNGTSNSGGSTIPNGHSPPNAEFNVRKGGSPFGVLGSKAADPAVIDKIGDTDLSNLKATMLGGSRGKSVHLFDADGKPTTSKADAVFMIDNLMPTPEQESYQKLEKILAKKNITGVKVPELHGHHKSGKPIMQWIPETTTFSAKSRLMTALNSLEKLADVNKNQPSYESPLKLDVLIRFSENIQSLIKLKYDSNDFQFMMDNKTGDIYIMDLEPNNQPKYKGANSQLSGLKAAVDQKIESLSKE